MRKSSYDKTSLFAMNGPRRVWILLWLAALGLTVSSASMAQPFIPREWHGVPISGALVVLLVIANGGPVAAMAVSIIIGALLAEAMWNFSLHPTDPRAIAFAVASVVVATAVAIRQYGRRAVAVHS